MITEKRLPETHKEYTGKTLIEHFSRAINLTTEQRLKAEPIFSCCLTSNLIHKIWWDKTAQDWNAETWRRGIYIRTQSNKSLQQLAIDLDQESGVDNSPSDDFLSLRTRKLF